MARWWLPVGLASAVLAAAGAIWHKLINQRDTDGSADCSDLQIVHKGQSLTAAHADEISILSYNVLAEVFASRLDYADAAILSWQYRWPLIQQLIRSWDADIATLQEVDVLWLQDYLDFAAGAGYEAVHQDPKGKQAICMTLYKPSKLKLWWQDARSRTLLAAFLFLDSTAATQVIYVANCHLEGSPYKPQERLNQIRSTLNSLQRHQIAERLSPSDCHVVIAGDLNSGQQEGVVKFLSQGWLPENYREPHLPHHVVLQEGGGDISHPYFFADAYARHPLPFTRKVRTQ
eukprot:GHRR01024999.1.p1 GENE.GHRR01024999.1~~GHRR01024999.1.p1  ORF type:complete len:289 (+),score=78.40 GHRR01024999.1:83-949(+)